ncbi:unnamed protein product [Urochloa humidicola]
MAPCGHHAQRRLVAARPVGAAVVGAGCACHPLAGRGGTAVWVGDTTWRRRGEEGGRPVSCAGGQDLRRHRWVLLGRRHRVLRHDGGDGGKDHAGAGAVARLGPARVLHSTSCAGSFSRPTTPALAPASASCELQHLFFPGHGDDGAGGLSRWPSTRSRRSSTPICPAPRPTGRGRRRRRGRSTAPSASASSPTATAAACSQIAATHRTTEPHGQQAGVYEVGPERRQSSWTCRAVGECGAVGTVGGRRRRRARSPGGELGKAGREADFFIYLIGVSGAQLQELLARERADSWPFSIG